jgi:hypothetical protein
MFLSLKMYCSPVQITKILLLIIIITAVLALAVVVSPADQPIPVVGTRMVNVGVDVEANLVAPYQNRLSPGVVMCPLPTSKKCYHLGNFLRVTKFFIFGNQMVMVILSFICYVLLCY